MKTRTELKARLAEKRFEQGGWDSGVAEVYSGDVVADLGHARKREGTDRLQRKH